MDRHTLLITQGGLMLFLAAILYFTFLERRRKRGDTSADWFALGFACAGTGLLLQSWRDSLPLFLVIVVGNSAFVFFGACFNRALARVARTRDQFWPLVTLEAAAIATFSWLTWVHPNILLRTEAAVLLIPVQCASLLWVISRNRDAVVRPAMRTLGFLFSLRVCLDVFYLLNTLRLHRVMTTPLSAWFGIMTITGTALAFLAIEILRLTHELQVTATTDPLTELLNRRGLEVAASREHARAFRQNRPCAALSLDINSFKQINDLWGHAAGDQALYAVAQALRSTLRATDVPARLGGDEFFVLLPDTAQTEADHAAARVRAVIEALDLTTFYGGRFKVSVSVGAVSLQGEKAALTDLMHASDIMLYQEKERRLRKGRRSPELSPVLAQSTQRFHQIN